MTSTEQQLYATLAVACFTFLTACATIIRAYFAYKLYKVEKERLDIKKLELEQDKYAT